jgi:hypothetical protein
MAPAHGHRGARLRARQHARRLSAPTRAHSWLARARPPPTAPHTGAGPFTNLGTRLQCAATNIDAQVVSVDPLAPSYHQILNKHGVHNTLRPGYCKSEDLLVCFCPGTFDLSIIFNALDHS